MKKLFISSKGQVIVLFALALVVLLALTGLAVDVGMAYGVRVKLNAAVDAAAIAAGKVISQGAGAASTQATNYFNANFPRGTLGSTVTSGPNIDAKNNPNGSWDITVTASATVPTTFARVVGWRNFTVSAIAATYIRTLDMVLVLDSSGSLQAPPGTPGLLKSAAKQFIQNFDASNDRIGLIHFASGSVSDVTMTTARGFSLSTIDNAIDNISVTGATTAEEALRRAQVQLDSILPASQSSLRAIVFFTDGAPNGVAGTFINGVTPVQGDLYSETDPGGAPNRIWVTNQQDNFLGTYNSIATLPATDYTGTVNLASYNNIRTFNPAGNPVPNTRCNVNRAARNMIENIANAARSEAGNPIHVFTIGLGDSLLPDPTKLEIKFCGYGSEEYGENILRRLANVPGVDTYNQNQPTGLYAFAADATQLNTAFNQVASAILRLTK